LEAQLQAIERIPSDGRGRPAQFIPYRFEFANKLSKYDKWSLAFDAFLLSEVLGRKVVLGKIVHGDRRTTLKVQISPLAGEVRERIREIGVLVSAAAPPDLVLNRHCSECEFQARCRRQAMEKDDLSLLSGMSEKERKKLHGKGIFTVTQLSYMFRPRRRHRESQAKQEKFHHSLRALAIREKKIHAVDLPDPKLEGTPVYLDVEGLPDRDFYYLVGLRVGTPDGAVQMFP
jgi:predicted RecB family nuclease